MGAFLPPPSPHCVQTNPSALPGLSRQKKPPARQPEQHPHPTEVSAPQAAAMPPQHLPGKCPSPGHHFRPVSPCSLNSSPGKRRGSSRPSLPSGWRHSQSPCKLPMEQKLLSRLPGCSKEAQGGGGGGAFSPTVCFEVCTPASC